LFNLLDHGLSLLLTMQRLRSNRRFAWRPKLLAYLQYSAIRPTNSARRSMSARPRRTGRRSKPSPRRAACPAHRSRSPGCSPSRWSPHLSSAPPLMHRHEWNCDHDRSSRNQRSIGRQACAVYCNEMRYCSWNPSRNC